MRAPMRHHHSPRPKLGAALVTLLGGFLGIGAVGLADQFVLDEAGLGLVIGAFGATAVLVFGAPGSPLAQPFNVLVGHVISAFIGVAAFKFLGTDWLSAGLAVGVAIFAMQMTRSLHPPGGASALIAVAGSTEIHQLGWLYPLLPVGIGAVILTVVALLFNNLRPDSDRWPIFWY